MNTLIGGVAAYLDALRLEGVDTLSRDGVTNGNGSTWLVGEVVRISANNTAVRSQAGAVIGLFGVTAEAIGAGSQGRIKFGGVAQVYMLTGLTLSAGQIIYVSGTLGRGTNVNPGSSAAFATILDTTGYATPTPYVTALLNVPVV